ncbi:MAG: ABC transporter substrate-binding protein [Deltaproteobacteria bacterium]|nr:ABC transporter substrate-binding protein [Deltaproteobacteria bacterium]
MNSLFRHSLPYLTPVPFFALLIVLSFAKEKVHAQSITAIKSVDIVPYNKAINAFKSCVDASVDEILIDYDEESGHNAAVLVSNENLHLIFTLGSDALTLVKDKLTHSTPVIFTFVLNPETIMENKKGEADLNITGISMNIPPYEQFKTMLQAAPKTKNIGTIYNSSKTGTLIKEAEKAAKKLGINLVSTEIRHKSEAINAITDMKGKIDAFWMAPDTTAITHESTEYMLLFSLRNNIPLIGISGKYVKNGALMAYTFDSEDVGRQAGEIAQQFLDGKPIKGFTTHNPRKLKLALNLKVAKKLGLKIPEDLIDRADKIYR